MATLDDQEICCHVTPLEIIESEDDWVSCNMFSIDIVASFMPQIDESDFEEDESELYNLECDIVEETFIIEREKLLSEETSWETIREILVSMNIPDESFLIDRILNCARQMGSNKHYMTRRVLYLKVEIDLPPRFASMDDIDIDIDVDVDDDFASGLVPASTESIEALERINVEDSINCAICLEEVLMGSEATRMPCLHSFHSMCVVNWLNKCRACPLCRNEIN